MSNDDPCMETLLMAAQKIARGREDCGRPLAAETSRQIARAALLEIGEDWPKANLPKPKPKGEFRGVRKET